MRQSKKELLRLQGMLRSYQFKAGWSRDPLSAFQWLLRECGSTQNYIFTRILTEFVREGAADQEAQLESFLQRYESEDTAVSLECAFAAMYALSIYYKHYDRIDDIDRLIDRFNIQFRTFPLWNELLSRQAKRAGKYQKALQYDEDAIETIGLGENINYGLLNSYASTICMLLRTGGTVTEEQLAKALKYVQLATDFDPDYPSYHEKQGLLLLYTDPDLARALSSGKSVESIIESIQKAKTEFELAIQTASERERYYTRRIIEYQSYISRAELRIQEARMTHISMELGRKEEELQKTQQALQEKSDSIEQKTQKLGEQFAREQHKILEILAIFVAVIQVSAVGINLANNTMSVTEILLILIGSTLCSLLLYLVFLIAKSDSLRFCLQASGQKYRYTGIFIAAAVALVLLALLILGLYLLKGGYLL